MNVSYRKIVILILVSLLSQPYVFSQTPSIGALADISGPSSRVGHDCFNGYVLAAENFKSELKVILGDNQNDAKAGLSEFKSMLDSKKIKAVVTTRSHIAMSFGNTANHYKVPVLGIASHPLFLQQNKYAFRFIANSEAESDALTAALIKSKINNIVIFTLADESYIALSQALNKKLEISKIPVIKSFELNPDEVDFKPYILKVLKYNPESIFINLGPSQLVNFIKKLRESGWNGQIVSNFLLASQDVQDSLGEMIENSIFTESDSGGEIFYSLYFDRFRAPPSQLSYSCYVAVSALSQAVALKPVENGQELYENLLKLEKIKVPDGYIEFKDREARFKSIAYTKQKNRKVKTDETKL